MYRSQGSDIQGHRYSQFIVKLSILLYTLCGCSLRGVVSVLSLLCQGPVPSKSSISNWVRKCGYYVYTHLPKGLYPKGYALILDESMVIGQERLLMALSVPAHKEGSKALALNQVRICGIQVRPSWKAVKMASFLQEIQDRIGSKAAYVVCDGDDTIKKALEIRGLKRIWDIGHELGRLLAHSYKTAPDFEQFCKDLSGVKFKEVMKPTCYLLPPKARTIARFMNLPHSVKWAQKMLNAFPDLTEIEQKAFDFLPSYQPLIKELVKVFKLINPLLKLIKTQGLNQQTFSQAKLWIEQAKQGSPARLIHFIQKVESFLAQEMEKLPDKEIAYHASSDIIESSFGIFKYRKSPNSLHGVTPAILLLPVLTALNRQEKKLNFDPKEALETVKLKDIDQWAQEYLVENQVRRRTKILKKVNSVS